jgi:hypothetical protein
MSIGGHELSQQDLQTISASIIIKAPAEAIFAVLVDPTKHAAIDGGERTGGIGWVRGPRDDQLLTASGQIFRMGMYHANHPNKNYETANRVKVFDPPQAISWETGYDTGDGRVEFGGWIWRYDLSARGPSETEVRLSYDWSAVPEVVRQRFQQWPPFSSDHLDDSLTRLAQLVAHRSTYD